MTPKMWEYLHRSYACSKAVAWVSDFDNPQSAWDACDRPDWMLFWWLCTQGNGLDTFKTTGYLQLRRICDETPNDWDACEEIRKLLPVVPLPEDYEDYDIESVVGNEIEEAQEEARLQAIDRGDENDENTLHPPGEAQQASA